MSKVMRLKKIMFENQNKRQNMEIKEMFTQSSI